MSDALLQGEDIPARHFGPIGPDMVRRYAKASGDDNPLHVDPSIAAKVGLAGIPIHGMLIMGSFQSFLNGWRPGVRVRKLSQKFIKPVFVGDGFTVLGKVVQAKTPAVIRLTVKDDTGALVGLAEAFVDP